MPRVADALLVRCSALSHLFSRNAAMPEPGNDSSLANSDRRSINSNEDRRQEALFKTGALQYAILNSANFSIIATDEKGIIQLFNVGAERLLGYSANDVVNRISPSEMHDPQEVMARAQALSLELEMPIAPGFEALSFKASRDIEDVYELTKIRKDGSRFPAIVSVTALRDDYGELMNYGDSLLNKLIMPYCQHGPLTSYCNSRLSTSCDTTW
jgi:PAS domain-containing protein